MSSDRWVTINLTLNAASHLDASIKRRPGVPVELVVRRLMENGYRMLLWFARGYELYVLKEADSQGWREADRLRMSRPGPKTSPDVGRVRNPAAAPETVRRHFYIRVVDAERVAALSDIMSLNKTAIISRMIILGSHAETAAEMRWPVVAHKKWRPARRLRFVSNV
jgi:hypothetical protein